jgi:hypothetical protein
MSAENQFVLVAITKNFLKGYWCFRASDELSVARHLLRHAWNYTDVFWALRVSLREVDQVTPEELLQAIRNSYYNQRVRAVLYFLRVSEPADCSGVESIGNAPGSADRR